MLNNAWFRLVLRDLLSGTHGGEPAADRIACHRNLLSRAHGGEPGKSPGKSPGKLSGNGLFTFLIF